MSRNRLGFTLVEIIISITIIAVAFYTLINVMKEVTLRNVGSQQLLTASFLAERVMEEFTMEGKDWNNDYVTQETRSFLGDFPNFSYRVDVECVDLSDLAGKALLPPTNYKRITVSVTGEAMSVPVVLTTLKVKYN